MNMNYFFDIPVYRLPSEKYYEELSIYKNKCLNDGWSEKDKNLKKQFYKKYPERKISLEEHVFKKFGGQWDFNEIIGYIKLYSVGNQIRGEYFQIDKKRICKTRTKIFRWETDKLVPEISFCQENTNEEIFDMIYCYIKDCDKELKYRYLDLDNFLKIGQYVDWQKLLNSEN